MNIILKGMAAGFLLLGISAQAYAVPATPLKKVQISDVACDNAVNEAELLKSLQEWVKQFNDNLSFLEKKNETQAIKILADDKNDFLLPLKDAAHMMGDAVLEPVLQRWAGTDFDEAKLSAAERKIFALLEGYGIKKGIVEGCPYLDADEIFFQKRIKFSEDGRAFLQIMQEQPKVLYSDGGLWYGPADMGAFAAEWERFMQNHQNSPFLQEAGKQYKKLIELMIFCDLPNSMAFPKSNGYRMTDNLKDLLRTAAENSAGTFTSRIISESLSAINANGGKLPSSLKKRMFAQIDKEFGLDVQQKPEAQKKSDSLSKAEQKIVGRHMFSLQWIEGGKMGTATVSRTESGLYIDAAQKHQGDYVTLKGNVTVMDEATFTVTGELVTRVSHIAHGAVCTREGTFEFKSTGKRKYWRLQEPHRLNPCDPVVDYVDIYF